MDGSGASTTNDAAFVLVFGAAVGSGVGAAVVGAGVGAWVGAAVGGCVGAGVGAGASTGACAGAGLGASVGMFVWRSGRVDVATFIQSSDLATCTPWHRGCSLTEPLWCRFRTGRLPRTLHNYHP